MQVLKKGNESRESQTLFRNGDRRGNNDTDTSAGESLPVSLTAMSDEPAPEETPAEEPAAEEPAAEEPAAEEAPAEGDAPPAEEDAAPEEEAAPAEEEAAPAEEEEAAPAEEETAAPAEEEAAPAEEEAAPAEEEAAPAEEEAAPAEDEAAPAEDEAAPAEVDAPAAEDPEPEPEPEPEPGAGGDGDGDAAEPETTPPVVDPPRYAQTKENDPPAAMAPMADSLLSKRQPVHAYLAQNIQLAVRHALRALSSQRPEEPFVLAADVIRRWTPEAPPPRLSRPAGGVAVGARSYLEDTGVLSVLHDGMCAMAKVRPQDPRQFIADYLLDHAPVPDYVKAMDSFDEKKVGAQMDALHEGAREVLANKVE